MLKIAYIVGVFPRIYNTFTLNDMVEVVRDGNKILIFSLDRPYESVVNPDSYTFLDNTYYFDDFIDYHSNLIHHLFYELVRKARIPRPFSRWLHKVAIATRQKSINLLRYHKDLGHQILALNGVAEKLTHEDVDIIHGAFSSIPTTAAMLLSKITGIPFTFEAHAKDLFVNFNFAEEKLTQAEKVFTISNFNKNYIIDRYRHINPHIVVKRVLFNKRCCDKLESTHKKSDLVVSVCRLDAIKGLDHAIEAFKIVAEKRKELKYVIIGDGPLKNHLIKKLERLSLGDRVMFLGSIPNEEVLDYISRASLVLLPSVIGANGDRDGIPTTLIEAMYLRTAVISSRISGIPELVDDGINGFLTEPGDVNEIAEKMDKLLSNESLRIELGQEAKRKIDRDFNPEKNIRKLINAWTEMV